MAKVVGIAGTIRGKIGTVVFVKGENGVSYGKAYQPSVANPRTAGQLAQRAKVNVVGRISKAATPEIIAALGGSRKVNRRIFNREMLKGAVVAQSNGEYTAAVDPAAVKFSAGAEVLHAVFANVVVGANKITYDVTLRDAELGGKYGERVVIGVVNPEDKPGVSYFMKDDMVLPDTHGETPQPISKEVYFPQELVNESMVVVWRCPFVISESGMSLIAGGLYNDDNEIVAKLMTNGLGSFRGWGESAVQLTEVFTTA